MDQDAGSDRLGRLRTLAIDHIRAKRWADLVALEPDLRADDQFWSSMWGPSCAIARWYCGRADARDLLEECIAAGFYEPDFETGFKESFGTEPDWPTPMPILERTRVIESEQLADTTADVAPDLAAIRTGVADRAGLALIFTADHPYATGFQVSDADRGTTTVPAGQPFPLAREAGEYRATVAAVTRYGTLTPQPLHYRVR